LIPPQKNWAGFSFGYGSSGLSAGELVFSGISVAAQCGRGDIVFCGGFTIQRKVGVDMKASRKRILKMVQEIYPEVDDLRIRFQVADDTIHTPYMGMAVRLHLKNCLPGEDFLHAFPVMDEELIQCYPVRKNVFLLVAVKMLNLLGLYYRREGNKV